MRTTSTMSTASTASIASSGISTAASSTTTTTTTTEHADYMDVDEESHSLAIVPSSSASSAGGGGGRHQGSRRRRPRRRPRPLTPAEKVWVDAWVYRNMKRAYPEEPETSNLVDIHSSDFQTRRFMRGRPSDNTVLFYANQCMSKHNPLVMRMNTVLYLFFNRPGLAKAVIDEVEGRHNIKVRGQKKARARYRRLAMSAIRSNPQLLELAIEDGPNPELKSESESESESESSESD